MLTQKRLRAVLDYDPHTGIFTWTRGARKGEVAGTRHDSRGFLKVSIDGKRHLLHRLAWLWMKGTMSRSNIEHADGDHSNNRWANLLQGDRIQKSGHRGHRRKLTDIEGVWRVGQKFEAMIDIDGQTLNLGSYATAEDADSVITQTLQRARENQRRKVWMAAR